MNKDLIIGRKDELIHRNRLKTGLVFYYVINIAHFCSINIKLDFPESKLTFVIAILN